MARSAPVRLSTPTSLPSASTAVASGTRAASRASNAFRGSVSGGRVTSPVFMMSPTWAKRSTSAQSASLTMPTGRPSRTTTAAPCDRLGISDSASATVWCGVSSMGVS